MPADHHPMLLRLNPDDFAAMLAMMQAGESRSDAVRRAIREAVPPRDIVLLCSKPPLFVEPVKRGPMHLLAAEAQGSMLMAKGWTVTVERVEPKMPAPAVEEEEEEDEPECQECGGLGNDHDEDCPRFAGEE